MRRAQADRTKGRTGLTTAEREELARLRQEKQPALARARRDAQLRVHIRASHTQSRRAYGRPGIWKDLHEAGERVSEKRMARLMREDGPRGRVRKRFRATTMSEHDQPIAPNV